MTSILARRAFTLALSLTLGALVVAGCHARPATPASLLRYQEPFTCGESLNDYPCIVCLKKHCCAQARACNERKDLCECANKCLGLGPTKACADACADPADKAMGTCAAESCGLICPGTGSTS